ncbi:MAG: hydantoinase B/oxoprolinase family protein [Chloroflexota bacterium]|nr:MAG: hydantoinase B/oxoprolinase family protein [Chloroflexota bacterium]
MRDPELLRHYKPEPASEREMQCMQDLGLIDYEVYGRKLEVACWEARDALVRMGVSPMIEAGDVAVGLYTANGDLSTAVTGTHLHLINGVLAVKYAMRYFKDNPQVGIRPGDIFFTNDASYGGMHNCDMINYMPIFHGDELVAWAVAATHETDTGAREPGGLPPSAESRYDEGMRICPIKIGENYTLRQDLVEMMENFVRDPRQQTLDNKARTACCYILERRVKEVIEKKGVELVIGIMRRMIDETAEAARTRIASLNDGTYRELTFVDWVGNDRYGLVKCAVNVHKVGDRVIVDFTGTGPRVLFANFNTLPHCMVAQTACYLYQFLFSDLKQSNGAFAPFEYIFPEGCVLNADPDDAIGLGVSTIAQFSSALHNAFEKMLMGSPDQRQNVLATWPGTSHCLPIAGVNKYGISYAGWDQGLPNGVGMGAKHDGDGNDVGGFIWCSVGEFIDSELFEAQYPVVPIFRSRYWKDGHGFGKYRGGRAIGGAWVVHDTPMLYALSLSGFCKFPLGRGLCGGYMPTPQVTIYVKKNNLKQIVRETPEKIPYDMESLFNNVEGERIVRHTASSLVVLEEDDIMASLAQGGPGYGDAIERDPKAVMKDLEDECISDWTAEQVYKVAYDPKTFTVDEARTAELRAAELEDRKRRGKPFKEFLAEWSQEKPKDEILPDYGPWPGVPLAPAAHKATVAVS